MPTLQDSVAVVAAIDPDAYTAAAYTSDWVDMSKFHDVMAIVSAGTMEATSTIDIVLRQATDSSGTGAKNITGKSSTQLTDSDDDKQVVLNCRADELDKDNSFDYLAVQVTVGTAASDMGAIIIGFDARYESATANDLASVDEIVS